MDDIDKDLDYAPSQDASLGGPTPGSRLSRPTDMTLNSDSHEFIALSLLHEWMRNVAAPTAQGVMLDFGCGGQPYRELFAPFVTRYIGADIAPARGIQLDLTISPGEPLSLPDRSVDTVLSTQVLEHVPDPVSYLSECRRVMRPNGRLIITVPMQWRHHEVPTDYFRFTRFGVSRLLRDQGFRVEDLRPCGGAIALIGQILCNFLANRGFSNRSVFRFINRASLWLDKRYPDLDDTLDWMCLARAPTDGQGKGE